MYVYIYMYVYVYVYMYVYIFILYTYICIYIFIYVYRCLYTYSYIIYIYIYIFIYIGYYTKESNDHFKDEKPLILGSEDWLPNYIPDWSLYKVHIHIFTCLYIYICSNILKHACVFVCVYA
jgi:hypothetical protein